MTSGMKVVQMGADPCSFFSVCDGDGLWDLCDSCSQKSGGQREDGCLVPALQRNEKEERECVGSAAAWTGVETEADEEDTWSVVHEGSWGWRWDRYQKYVLSLASFARHHTAMLEAARTTRRCVRSAHHGTFSADYEGKRGSSGDLSSRTNACRPQETDPWGDRVVSSGAQKTERIEDQTVDVPVQQKIFEEIMDVPQERLSKRTGEQFDDSFASHEGDLWSYACVSSGRQPAIHRGGEPLIMEEIFETMRMTPHEQITARIEQIIEVSVPQDTEQLIEVTKIESCRVQWKRSLMFTVHHRLRNLRRRQRSMRWCKSFHLSACSSVVWSSLWIWQLRTSWRTLLKWCDWCLRSVIESVQGSTLSIFLNNRSWKRSARRSTGISRRGDTDWRPSVRVTGARCDAGGKLSPRVTGRRGDAGRRLSLRVTGRLTCLRWLEIDFEDVESTSWRLLETVSEGDGSA